MTQAAATASTTAAPTEARDDTMPKGIPYIVANEFAERFCYYGINAILSVYMTRHLHLGEADATTFHSLFKSAAYFAPLLGAIVSDVFWGKYKTILTFSLSYCAGCAIVALVPGTTGLLVGLSLVALGTGGIKPCVATNVGDQFTSKNQHLIERAFSYFYLAINSGSSISIFFAPILLDRYGRIPAFGIPAAMMFFATVVFWMGRKKFAVVPPAGKKWLKDIVSPQGLKTLLGLGIIYVFLAPWWALWEQSNGQTWTLQAESSLMDKELLFGWVVKPAQILVANAVFILALVPVFTFAIFPLWSKITKVTPLRKIGVGLFVMAAAYLIMSMIEGRIQSGQSVSVWWQILAYVVLTASEVLVSITGLEFSYKQAPPGMKSFIMSLFLFSISLGDILNAAVSHYMIEPVKVEAVAAGAETWLTMPDVKRFIVGQKIDFGGENGLTIAKAGKPQPLGGTFLVERIDEAGHRLALMDIVERKPIASTGAYGAGKSKVSTYALVGPQYFNFYAGLISVVGLLFIGVAILYKEKNHYRDDEGAAAA